MAKNCMAAVAKMLGVELGEEFIIENKDSKETVVFAADGFHVIQPNDVLGPDHGKLLSKVLQGLYEVKKKPWVPKNCDDYYILNVETGRIECYSWGATTFDLALKSLGIIHRTEEEAKAHLHAEYKRLTGKTLSYVE